ncbi:MAG: bifunctional riboflavin kinase/FAD synthetase [Candidatus Omnitrophica bacterium]|nr:bifunctional riboflavin kinase/FAD synthetase [Candidatus Omnitrophota bacterium]MCK5260303.1 bifunctional riboflavin kinase/FAD synthetase [Candidatus Omnitrophota bacterium]
MKVIYGIGKVDPKVRKAVWAIGVFDGLHIGHQKLIKTTVRRAKKLSVPAVVMTFSPHPVQVLYPNSCLPFIVSLPHRLKLIEELGITVCIVVRFTKRFSRLTARQFIHKYLDGHLSPKEIFVGADFCFGQKKEGTVAFFKEAGRAYGFKVHAIAPVTTGQKKIGSSQIRRLITQGKLNAARRLLGRPVSIFGKVVKGDGRGRTLGFPTANVYPGNETVLPVGVYAVRVIAGHKKFPGMANVGRRPSFKKKTSRINIETHLFDFKGSLYGKEIVVQFIKKIRSERVFASPEKMTAQLARDEAKCRDILYSR